MGSKLRPLYDKLYMGIDTSVVAYCDRKAARRTAKTITVDAEFENAFRTKIVPYWKQFGVRAKKDWYKIYCSEKEKMDPRYIPTDLWSHRIVPHYNKVLFAQALQDKNQADLLVPGVKRPETVAKNISGVFYDDRHGLLTRQQAIERCLEAGDCIIKPAIGSGEGNGISFFVGTQSDEKDIRELFERYKANFIVQKVMKEHPDIARIHAASLNTMRIITFLYQDEVRILGSSLRIGVGQSRVDNIAKGGLICRIRPDGKLDKYAYGKDAQKYAAHPDGFVFEDAVIPSFDKVIETAKLCASRMGHFRLIGWDFAVDESGDPVLIEFNVIPGISCQMAVGPLFGDLTEQVLGEVFKRR